MGMVIGLAIVILPYGMYAVHELRARMAYQARAISVLARTQHVIAQTNSDAAIAQSAQITETLRNNALHMHDLRRNATLEVFWSPTQIHLLRNTFEHLDRQLPMLLSKSIAVDGSRGQSVDDQPDQVAFLELMDPSWAALELAVTSVNDEMILSEMERREPSDACWSELDSCIQNFGEKVQLARRQVCYTQDCGPPTAESIERHTRRMAHLFFVEQHARTVLALRPVHRQPVVEWTWAGVATQSSRRCAPSIRVGGRAWRRPTSSEVVRAVKLSMALIVCMLFEVVDELRDSHLMERQGAAMLFCGHLRAMQFRRLIEAYHVAACLRHVARRRVRHGTVGSHRRRLRHRYVQQHNPRRRPDHLGCHLRAVSHRECDLGGLPVVRRVFVSFLCGNQTVAAHMAHPPDIDDGVEDNVS